MSNILEENYKRITKDLKTPLNEKINIYIYSDLDSFHEAIGQPNARQWVAGTEMGNNTIRMVSPYISKSKESYDYIIKVLIHEFANVIVRHINNERVPVWLNEGVPTFEANQFDDFTKKLIKSSGDSSQVLNLSKEVFQIKWEKYLNKNY